MKVTQTDLDKRLIDVSAALRGAEALERPAPKAPSALMEGALRSAADSVADEVVAGLTKYRDTGASFGVWGLISQASKGRSEEERKELLDNGFPAALEDRLAALVHSALIQRGYSAQAVHFDSRDNYDGLLELRVSGVKAGVAESTEAHARLVRGPDAVDPQQKRAVHTVALHTTAKLLTDAAAEVAVFDKYVDRLSAPEGIRTATVALEKAARQLEQLRGVEIGAAQAEPYREVQRAYATLLFALSSVEHAYQHGYDADQELQRRKDHPGSGLQQIGTALLEKTGLMPGNYERRIQDALTSLYSSAPVRSTRPTQIAAHDYVAAQFSWASAELLADPAKADLLLKSARQLELADLALETKDTGRARALLRDVAANLCWSMGPTLVAAQMIARLGDLEMSAGRNDKASRAYVGALRVMNLHLPKEHVLVREVAAKLKESGERWIASLDPNKSQPMPYEARSARATAETVAKELDLQGILSSTAPAITTPPGADPATFAEALTRARPGELHTPPTDLYWQLHYAILGPMRG